MLSAAYLLVELEPRAVAFAVGVLQTEEPDLPQSNRLYHLKSHKPPKAAVKSGGPSNWVSLSD